MTTTRENAEIGCSIDNYYPRPTISLMLNDDTVMIPGLIQDTTSCLYKGNPIKRHDLRLHNSTLVCTVNGKRCSIIVNRIPGMYNILMFMSYCYKYELFLRIQLSYI